MVGGRWFATNPPPAESARSEEGCAQFASPTLLDLVPEAQSANRATAEHLAEYEKVDISSPHGAIVCAG